MNKIKTILLVGGGTGGHIVPVLNIQQALWGQRKKINIVTVGGDSPMDQKLYTGFNNHIILRTGKLHRSFTMENLLQVFLLIWGIFSALVILRKIKPNLIFSKAGYVSFPIILWAKIFRIPYFIHESDIEMGAANKFAASGASRMFVGFPTEYYSKMYGNKLKYTGQILPANFLNLEDASFDFGFNDKKPVIFITGGSQGAKNINKAIFQVLPNILEKYNIIHHTGSLDFDKAIQIRTGLSGQYRNSYFISPLLTKKTKDIDMMKSAINQADLVITRASATTLAEIAALKKAIIAVPYKYAAANHQAKNAAYYKRHRAAVVIIDDKLNGKILEKQIDTLFSHRALMKELGNRAHDLQNLDGLSTITEEIDKNLSIGKYEEI